MGDLKPYPLVNSTFLQIRPGHRTVSFAWDLGGPQIRCWEVSSFNGVRVPSGGVAVVSIIHSLKLWIEMPSAMWSSLPQRAQHSSECHIRMLSQGKAHLLQAASLKLLDWSVKMKSLVSPM